VPDRRRSPTFGIQAARALLLSGPEVGPEPAGRPLERCVAAWAAASEATLTMLWRLRRIVLAGAILAARPLRRARVAPILVTLHELQVVRLRPTSELLLVDTQHPRLRCQGDAVVCQAWARVSRACRTRVP
jgi:hypothetical protein